MIARILNPFTTALLAFVLALAVGPGLLWYKSMPLLERLLAQRRAQANEVAEAHAGQKAKGWDFWTVELEALEGDLKAEKAALEKQKDAMDRRQTQLDAESSELDRVRSDLNKMQASIDAKVIEMHADELKNLRSLAQTYATLDAPSAVAILRDMDDVTVVKILSLEKATVTAPIFEEMARTPDGAGGTLAKRAADLSEKIRMMKNGVVATSSTP